LKPQQLYLRLSSFYFVYFFMVGAFQPFFALYLKGLAFASFQIGVLLALAPIVRTFMPTLWAWMADHYGTRRRLVRWTCVWAFLSCAGLLAGTSFAWLFAVLLALNVFWCAALPLVEATTVGVLQGRMGDYGRIRVWGSVSFVVAVLLVGPLLQFGGLHLLPWVLLVLFAALTASAWLLPSDRAQPPPAEHVRLAAVLRKPEVLALLAACFLMAVAHGPYNTFFSIHLVELGYSTTMVSWMWALSVIAEIGVFLIMPLLLRRFSIPAVIAVSLGCAVARFLMIGWGAESMMLVALAQLLHAATFGAHHAAALGAIHHFFRGRHQARGQALYTSFGFGAGGALGTFLSGSLWDYAGAGLTFSFGAGAAALALAVVLLRLRLPVPAGAAA
jgi:PPP family 3-phenylpropionic acid transporter